MDSVGPSQNTEAGTEQQTWNVVQQHPYAYMAGQHMAYVPDNSAYGQSMWGAQMVQFVPGPHGQFYGGVMPGFPTVAAVPSVTSDGCAAEGDNTSHAAVQDQVPAADVHAVGNSSAGAGAADDNASGRDHYDPAPSVALSADTPPLTSQQGEPALATAASLDPPTTNDHNPPASEAPWAHGAHAVPVAVDSGSMSILDEREVKRQRRKQSNRESARRSRLRKQQETEKLAKTVQLHQVEIAKWRSHVQLLNSNLQKLAEQVRSLGGEVDATLLNAPMPVSTEPADELSDSDPAANDPEQLPSASAPQSSTPPIQPAAQPASAPFSQVQVQPMAAHPPQQPIPVMHHMTMPHMGAHMQRLPMSAMPLAGMQVAGLPMPMMMATSQPAASGTPLVQHPGSNPEQLSVAAHSSAPMPAVLPQPQPYHAPPHEQPQQHAHVATGVPLVSAQRSLGAATHHAAMDSTQQSVQHLHAQQHLLPGGATPASVGPVSSPVAPQPHSVPVFPACVQPKVELDSHSGSAPGNQLTDFLCMGRDAHLSAAPLPHSHATLVAVGPEAIPQTPVL